MSITSLFVANCAHCGRPIWGVIAPDGMRGCLHFNEADDKHANGMHGSFPAKPIREVTAEQLAALKQRQTGETHE